MNNNFHTHTYRCKHAGGSERDYLSCAIEKGLSILGFSDHAPYPDDRFGLRMDFCELQDYLDQVNLLKKEQVALKEIIVKSGLEIEYDPRESAYYKKLLEEYGFDYLLMGQHFYITPQGTAQNVYELTSTDQYLLYAQSLVDAMASGFFSAFAHPDLIFINNFTWDENCQKACEIIVQGAVKHHTILEFNANGIRRGKSIFIDGERYPYPHDKFWYLVAASQVPTIISSDCHSPNQVWDETMISAHQIAKELGLNIVDTIF